MTLGWRWVKFNLVGAAGFIVQLAALALFNRVLGWHYLAATAVAVELAVIHNYAWHELWTWRDRPGSRAARLLRFHLGNGVLSIVANVVLMRLFVGVFGWGVMISNGVAVALVAVLNFAVGEWWVFRAAMRSDNDTNCSSDTRPAKR